MLMAVPLLGQSAVIAFKPQLVSEKKKMETKLIMGADSKFWE
jgi:hypothetical protein